MPNQTFPTRRTCALTGVTSALLAAVVATLSLGARAEPARSDASLRELAAALHSHSIVLLGEVHDNAAQHALRARALREWLESGARPALLMEMFDRERQPDLDRVLATQRAAKTTSATISAATIAATVEALIRAGGADGTPMPGWDWALYRPYIALAVQYRLPLIAANVSRDDTRRVIEAGLPALGFDASVPGDIESAQADAIVAGHCGMIAKAPAQRMIGAQIARDQWMARLLERHAPANTAATAVLLAGNGHVRSDIGVPRWLSAPARARSVAVGLLEAAEVGGVGDPMRAAFDMVLTTPAQPRPDPCEAFRNGSGGPMPIPTPIPTRTRAPLTT